MDGEQVGGFFAFLDGGGIMHVWADYLILCVANGLNGRIGMEWNEW
jgi:hypothetical protein